MSNPANPDLQFPAPADEVSSWWDGAAARMAREPLYSRRVATWLACVYWVVEWIVRVDARTGYEQRVRLLGQIAILVWERYRQHSYLVGVVPDDPPYPISSVGVAAGYAIGPDGLYSNVFSRVSRITPESADQRGGAELVSYLWWSWLRQWFGPPDGFDPVAVELIENGAIPSIRELSVLDPRELTPSLAIPDRLAPQPSEHTGPPYFAPIITREELAEGQRLAEEYKRERAERELERLHALSRASLQGQVWRAVGLATVSWLAGIVLRSVWGKA